jgi:hypothetical protein
VLPGVEPLSTVNEVRFMNGKNQWESASVGALAGDGTGGAINLP